MRVLAGPNGSGKSSALLPLLSNLGVGLGVYVNADDIEKELRASGGRLDLRPIGLTLSDYQIKDFFKQSQFAPVKRNEPNLYQKVGVEGNAFVTSASVDSYLAADLAAFFRTSMLESDTSFTFETVMSHRSKVDIMLEAKAKGFKVYLYFVATESPETNVGRVALRVSQQGHPVAADTIRRRYYNSLEILREAVAASDSAFIFDNSGSRAVYICQITSGRDVEMNQGVTTPNWALDYLLEPKS